jgi:hypothetical protein
MNDKLNLDRNGFVVKRNFFSKFEIIEFLKIQKLLHKKKNAKFGPIHKSRITWKIILNKKIKDLLYHFYTNKKVAYLFHGHSAAQDKFASFDTSWHRDNACRTFGKGPDWDKNYNVLRVAIYLDNCESGLRLIKGSHRAKGYICYLISFLRTHFKILYHKKIFRFFFDRIIGTEIRVKKGDCLFFFANTYHSAININDDKQIENTRKAIFLTYGIHNKHSYNHLNYYLFHRTDKDFEFKEKLKKEFFKILKKNNLYIELPKKKINIEHASL